MGRRTRAAANLEGRRQAEAAAQIMGRQLRESRLRRRMTQAELGRRVGLHHTRVSQVERGGGASLSLAGWHALAAALDRPLRTDLGRDRSEEPADAGHLLVQELVLRLGRATGYAGTFELPTRPASPGRSVDVCLRDDRRRRLILVEAWNTIDDIGAAARAFDRKLAQATELATVLGGEGRAYSVHGCWVVRATRRNRALVARYPEVFAARFPAPSLGWVRALTRGEVPPGPHGLVWCDVAATRLFAWRRDATMNRP
ncbi:MAG TPA: helix-turn-helix transcriptional regulator [Candidatus Limnocylindrales bacterium]|nr:helix-turn-helix transcriptional regulator [Candidatus Limnocylindrales bacterium]